MSETLKGIANGEYGKPIVFTAVDAAGVAVDISTYSISVVFHVLRGTEEIILTGSFVTTGTDGKVTCAFTSTKTPVLFGDWRAQLILTKTGVRAISEPIDVKVWEEI